MPFNGLLAQISGNFVFTAPFSAADFLVAGLKLAAVSNFSCHSLFVKALSGDFSSSIDIAFSPL
jgi:hypothetical protein